MRLFATRPQLAILVGIAHLLVPARFAGKGLLLVSSA
jgi:hypothetical protein